MWPERMYILIQNFDKNVSGWSANLAEILFDVIVGCEQPGKTLFYIQGAQYNTAFRLWYSYLLGYFSKISSARAWGAKMAFLEDRYLGKGSVKMKKIQFDYLRTNAQICSHFQKWKRCPRNWQIVNYFRASFFLNFNSNSRRCQAP